MYPTFMMLVGTGRVTVDKPEIKDKKFNSTLKILVSTIMGDAFLSTTLLVVGILGALSVIHGLPPAASYTFIALSGVITTGWIALTILSKGDSIKAAAHILKEAVSPNQENPFA